MAGRNSTPSDFYVYLHRRATDGSVFYVGKGCKQRAWWEFGRSEYWNRIKNKHGFVVEILKDEMSENDAHMLEIETIKTIGRENLCNHTDGGEGMYGWHASIETRKKFSLSRTGRKHTDEAKQKMSDSHRGVSKSKEHVSSVSKALTGRKFSDEHRKNLSEAIKQVKYNPEWGKKSGAARMKKVFCLNNSKEYESTKHAARELKVDSGSVSMVCTGKYKHTKGYVFEYVKNENI